MEFSDVMSLIGSYAFPIVMCVAFFWRQYKSDEEHREEMESIRKSHAEETARMMEAINNNTLALQRLADKLEAKA